MKIAIEQNAEVCPWGVTGLTETGGKAVRENCVWAKLRSQQGASILFAIFFFIVCAVIGSIVLTAGSAAAGRLAEIEAMDDRYYAVTSAAKLLETQLDDPDTVVIRRKELTADTPVWTVDDYLDAAAPAADIPSLLRLSVCQVHDADLEMKYNLPGVQFTRTLTLTKADNPKLNARAVMVMDGKGNVTLQVQDPEGIYVLKLDCPAHVLTSTYTAGLKKEQVETITWSVASVQKG